MRKIFYSYLNIKCIGAYSVSVRGKSGLNCYVTGGGFPVFRRRVAPRPGSVLIILSKNIVKNMRVRPAPSPRGRTRPVIANRFFDALRIRIYALRNPLRVFTVFYGGVNDL